MNPLDLGVVAVIGLSAIFAFARGFVREALSIVAWVGAGFITLYSYPTVEAMVEPMVHNPLLSGLAGIAGTFIVCLIVLTVLTGIIARTVRSSALSPIDRTLGFGFGLLRGAFILSLAYLMLDMVQPNDRPQWLKDAKSAPYLEQGANLIRGFLPEQWRAKSAAAADDVIHAVSPAAEAEKAMRALTNPTAPAPGADQQQSVTPSYNPTSQRELDRLINNQR
ncbi:MAG TPA: CvpA family protein [Stellaceae bacterium]|nr:CvpA family protein [Stellaceae bacterium]